MRVGAGALLLEAITEVQAGTMMACQHSQNCLADSGVVMVGVGDGSMKLVF
jgi:hypothetical protein